MNQNTEEQNKKEWKNLDNWTLPVGFYFSKKDTRWLVPRPNRNLGWTYNLGHKKGTWALLFSFLIPILLLTGILLAIVFSLLHGC